MALSLTKVPWSRDDLYFNFAIWLRYARRQRQLAGRRSIQLACVKYEDLVRDPADELRKLTDFLNLSFEPRMADGTGCEARFRKSVSFRSSLAGSRTTSSYFMYGRHPCQNGRMMRGRAKPGDSNRRRTAFFRTV